MYSARHRILGHERPGVAVMHPALTATELKVPTVTNGMRHLVSTLWTQNYAVFEERALCTPVRGVKTELTGVKMCECAGRWLAGGWQRRQVAGRWLAAQAFSSSDSLDCKRASTPAPNTFALCPSCLCLS